MFEAHKASYHRMHDFTWSYTSENGHDIGWQLFKESGGEPLANVVGSENAYQVMAGDLIMDGIYENLSSAKKAAEKYIFQFIG